MNNMKRWGMGLLAFASVLSMQAQRVMNPQDLVDWKRITSQTLSNNGKWAACVMAPWKGDAQVQIYATDGKLQKTYLTAPAVSFSASSAYALVKQVPAESLMDSLKLSKAQQSLYPQNKLVIRRLADGKETWIDSLKNYQLSASSDVLAYQKVGKDSTMIVTSLDGQKEWRMNRVSTYGFAKDATALYFVTREDKDGVKPGFYLWKEGMDAPQLIKEGEGLFIHTTLDKKGERVAFLYAADDKAQEKNCSLWLADASAQAKEIVNRETAGMNQGWILSPNASLHFSDDASLLWLGTAPEPLQKDPNVLDKNRPNVQVWSWNEPVQYTCQLYNLKKDLARTYLALYRINDQKLIQLADEELPYIDAPMTKGGDWALLYTSKPYSLSLMWEGRTRNDYYRVSLNSGERTLLAKADYGRYRLSPKGNYTYGYNQTDSCWYSFSMKDNRRIKLTQPETFVAWDEENDVPNYPEAHGCLGWNKDESALLIYDRYDIWAFNPEGKNQPVNLTRNGRENQITYRYVSLNPDEEAIDLKGKHLLTGFNEKDKSTALYSARLDAPAKPAMLIGGEYAYGNVAKAKEGDRYLFTCENFYTYPDMWVAAASFKKPVRLTEGYRQQEEFKWGSIELVTWTSLDGHKMEGLLCKPADFDPNKKYPMIVNFYERYSHTYCKYRQPEPHRSTVDYRMYLSDGYVIFNPNIRYRDGYPGESCFSCVMSGIAEVLSRGFVDEKRIGAQGHSWGGYQTAYLATRTKLFAAIESGAPVVNMFSAYGGIRWGSGLARAFQYEHTQSRLGATPWTDPRRYYENSPLFLMDKVQTPILIMHNDQDGHVPWYQGIEYFVSLKRLGKPAWMLNYTGSPHWPAGVPNRLDFQIRMKQFFDHYLKGEPMPKWMKDGLPAVKQPFELGY